MPHQSSALNEYTTLQSLSNYQNGQICQIINTNCVTPSWNLLDCIPSEFISHLEGKWLQNWCLTFDYSAENYKIEPSFIHSDEIQALSCHHDGSGLLLGSSWTFLWLLSVAQWPRIVMLSQIHLPSKINLANLQRSTLRARFRLLMRHRNYISTFEGHQDHWDWDSFFKVRALLLIGLSSRLQYSR